jgi:hypothetical protein
MKWQGSDEQFIKVVTTEYSAQMKTFDAELVVALR